MEIITGLNEGVNVLNLMKHRILRALTIVAFTARVASMLVLAGVLLTGCGPASITSPQTDPDTRPAAPEPLLSLRSAQRFALLGGTAVTCTGGNSVTGDVGVSPAGAVAGSPQCGITGGATPHVNDAIANTAQAEIARLFDVLSAMPCARMVTTRDLAVEAHPPATYCVSSTAAVLTRRIIFDAKGDANATFVVRTATALTVDPNSSIVLIGGAQAKNVYWQVGTSASIGQNAAFQGNILAVASITLAEGATLKGRALSKGRIAIDRSGIALP